MRRVTPRLASGIPAPGEHERDDYAASDKNIGDVKDREVDEGCAEEVSHAASRHAVDEIAHSPARDGAKRADKRGGHLVLASDPDGKTQADGDGENDEDPG